LENGLDPHSCSEVGTSSALCLEVETPSTEHVVFVVVVVVVVVFVVVVVVVVVVGVSLL
jgi:hypothetical protein